MNAEQYLQYEKAMSSLNLVDGVMRITELSVSTEVQKMIIQAMKELGGKYDKEKAGFVFPSEVIEELKQSSVTYEDEDWALKPEFVIEKKDACQSSLF